MHLTSNIVVCPDMSYEHFDPERLKILKENIH
jgi:hypothetical protein